MGEVEDGEESELVATKQKCLEKENRDTVCASVTEREKKAATRSCIMDPCRESYR